ncbi:hypothetical protein DCAR_0100150 [Daucus carota subsp. sativus]|uniref:Uncharacterized protein n=1 Tax=Daucus carota subsp. sativus TaxID=79200 RepID=A0AAF0VZB9_DAUCS|nr:hypothetical protein DCAR_0100150 [Daucus carota subsp. sativus]
MAQDDSTYRGRNGIGCFHPPVGGRGHFHREGFNPATGSPTATLLRLHPSRRPHRVMGDHWPDASGETNSQGVTGGVYRARHVCGPAHKEHLPPPSYRGCWHGVSRGFFLESCHDRALDERGFTSGIALLHSRDIAGSGFRPLSKIPHCCPRGSPGRVSVPVWLIVRKDQLSIIGLYSLFGFRKHLQRSFFLWKATGGKQSTYLIVGRPGRILPMYHFWVQ